MTKVSSKWVSMRIIFFALAMIISFTVSAQDIEEFITTQMKTYPKSRLLDIYKSCFQDFMGAEHLVSDKQRVKAYLDEELASISLEDLQPWYYEPCGIEGNYIRVSIRTVMEGLVSEDVLLDAFIRSANRWGTDGRQSGLNEQVIAEEGKTYTTKQPTVEEWSLRWHMIMGVIDRMQLNLRHYEEDRQFLENVLAAGKYAISHSPDYSEAYHPHYRIVERSIFEQEIKPVIDQSTK